MPEKRHYALGVSDVHLKLDSKRQAFLIDDDLRVFGVFDILGNSPENAAAVERMADVLKTALTDNRRVIDRYTTSGGYYHRVRATLTIEMAIQQASREARHVMTQGILPRLTLIVLCGHNAIIARHFPAEVFHITEHKLRHITVPLPGEPTRDDSGVTSSKSALAKARAAAKEQLPSTPLPDHALPATPTPDHVAHPAAHAPGSATPAPAAGHAHAHGHRAPKLEMFHTESHPGDVYILANEGLGEYLTETWGVQAPSAKENAGESLRQAVRQASLKQADRVITGIYVKIVGAATEDELKLEEKVAPLRSVPVFKSLATNELLKLLRLMEAREFKAWERIISEDDPGELLYVAIKGKFSVYKKGSLIAELGEGAVFGEIGFINKLPRTADVVATEKTTMLILSRSQVKKLLATEPQIASHLLWSLCQILTDRLAKTTQELSNMMSKDKARGQTSEDIGLIEDSDDRKYSPHRGKK